MKNVLRTIIVVVLMTFIPALVPNCGSYNTNISAPPVLDNAGQKQRPQVKEENLRWPATRNALKACLVGLLKTNFEAKACGC